MKRGDRVNGDDEDHDDEGAVQIRAVETGAPGRRRLANCAPSPSLAS